MKLTYVIRSYVGRVLEIGTLRIREWAFVEVDKATMDGLGVEALTQLRDLRDRHEVSISMLKGTLPVASWNEAAVLQEEADSKQSIPGGMAAPTTPSVPPVAGFSAQKNDQTVMRDPTNPPNPRPKASGVGVQNSVG